MREHAGVKPANQAWAWQPMGPHAPNNNNQNYSVIFANHSFFLFLRYFRVFSVFLLRRISSFRKIFKMWPSDYLQSLGEPFSISVFA